MNRRTLVRSALILGALLVASGHTPYRQWKVYRQRHLLILTSRSDAPTFELGKRVAAALAEYLPASKARVSRAPDTQRIASLISTKQMEVAILSLADAGALSDGRAPFANFAPVALRTLLRLGDYLLVCRDDFPARHAYLVVETLIDHLAAPVPDLHDTPAVPLHAGARDFLEGRPVPPQDDEDDD